MNVLSRVIGLVTIVLAFAWYNHTVEMDYSLSSMEDAMLQFQESSDVGTLHARMMNRHYNQSLWRCMGWVAVLIAMSALMWDELRRLCKHAGIAVGLGLLLSTTGCWRPFEPVKLEVIQPNAEAFLLPFTESIERQTSTHTEEYLRKSLVHTQQVKIPQQWVPRGYEVLWPNGEWRDAAILVRVDKSPVTREWTADPNSGTSIKNEAIWVMTSDQVEFSTGWTCTARVSSRDDAVKFLHNYPNGALTQVMDQEIRAKIQSAFGLEVTDLPMEELRLKATPHIQEVTTKVIDFFQERGITITNLGISGGFVYKDPSIVKTMVEVFNAEQSKMIAIAETAMQLEKNKKLELEAQSRAKAILSEKEAEAEGIRLVADAKSYELSKVTENSAAYMQLKRLQIDSDRIEKWDGRYPGVFLGMGTNPIDAFLSLSPQGESPVGPTSSEQANLSRR